MIKSTFTFLFITLATALSGFAQEDFNKKMNLNQLSPGWYKGYLPYEVVNNASIGLDDIRILQIVGNDTIEAPYVLMPFDAAHTKVRVSYVALNKSSNKEGYFVTFKLNSEQPITELELVSSHSNYDWNVTLEGSMNQKDWYTIVDHQKLVRIRDGRVNFTHNTLHFPPAQYTYFRVQIESDKDPQLHHSNLYFQKEITTPIFTHKARFKSIINTSNKQSYSIDLQSNKTFNSIQFEFADTLPYYRTFSLYEFIDSVKIKTGWHKNYRLIQSGTLSSLTDNLFQFRVLRTEQLKLEINNYDNPPLSLISVHTFYPKQNLITRIAENGEYSLYFDAPNTRPPHYDLAHFVSKDTVYAPLAFGKIETIHQNTTESKQPVLESQWWLWGVLILIIATMAFAVFKMMMKAD